MTPDQIQNKLNEAVMNIQSLQYELDALKSNLSEKPNSCEPDHYIPQPGEVVLIGDYKDNLFPRIFLKYNSELEYPFSCLPQSHEEKYRKGEKYCEIDYKYCDFISGEIIEFGCDKPKDYTHLLPAGYEFCKEEEMKAMLKVELTGLSGELLIGTIAKFPKNIKAIYKKSYRPIRPIQFHVAVHEAVTTEPNPYAVDWSNAPEWADVHCYNKDGEGFWYGAIISEYYEKWLNNNMDSGHTLPTRLDWKLSKTVRPK